MVRRDATRLVPLPTAGARSLRSSVAIGARPAQGQAFGPSMLSAMRAGSEAQGSGIGEAVGGAIGGLTDGIGEAVAAAQAIDTAKKIAIGAAVVGAAALAVYLITRRGGR